MPTMKNRGKTDGDLANQLGALLGKSPTFIGAEGTDALLSNSTLSQRLFGPPRISTDQLLRWTAHWLNSNGAVHGKPTKFQVRDGKF